MSKMPPVVFQALSFRHLAICSWGLLPVLSKVQSIFLVLSSFATFRPHCSQTLLSGCLGLGLVWRTPGHRRKPINQARF